MLPLGVLSQQMHAGFNLSTDMNSFCPPLSIVKVLSPACMTLNGPLYGRWKGVW